MGEKQATQGYNIMTDRGLGRGFTYTSDGNAMHFRPITSPGRLLHERVWLRLRFHQSLTVYDYDYEYTASTA